MKKGIFLKLSLSFLGFTMAVMLPHVLEAKVFSVNTRADAVDDNPGDGFNINGANLDLKGTVAKNNGADGIDVDSTGTGVVMKGSQVRNNAGTGIENEAQGTDIINNTALGNRTDIAGAGDGSPPVGTVTQFSGNTWKTGDDTTSTPNTGIGDN